MNPKHSNRIVIVDFTLTAVMQFMLFPSPLESPISSASAYPYYYYDWVQNATQGTQMITTYNTLARPDRRRQVHSTIIDLDATTAGREDTTSTYDGRKWTCSLRESHFMCSSILSTLDSLLVCCEDGGRGMFLG